MSSSHMCEIVQKKMSEKNPRKIRFLMSQLADVSHVDRRRRRSVRALAYDVERIKSLFPSHFFLTFIVESK